MICVLYRESGDGFGERDDTLPATDVLTMHRESHVTLKPPIPPVVDIGHHRMKSVATLQRKNQETGDYSNHASLRYWYLECINKTINE